MSDHEHTDSLDRQGDSYTMTVATTDRPDIAAQRVTEALAEEGFGILTTIDIQATLKAKLDVDMPAYTILGACNPALAHEALGTDPDIGALLPCNIVVRANPEGGTDIVAIDPAAMLDVSPAADALQSIAGEARTRIQRALSSAAESGRD